MTLIETFSINGVSYERNPKTSDGKQQKLDQIAANYSPEQLKRETAPALRLLATGIVTQTKAKKLELAAILIEATEVRRTQLKLANADLLLKREQVMQLEGLNPAYLLSLCTKHEDPQAAVDELFHRMKSLFADSTIARTHTPELIKWLQTHPDLAPDYVAAFKKFWYEVVRPINTELNINYKQAVHDRNQARVPIAIEPLQELAVATLSELNRASWKHVAYALALCTGRRMAEVLGNHSSYVVEGPDKLLFTGQLKQKREEDERGSFLIPTFVDSALVVAGFEALQSKQIDPTLVNSRYSKALSTELDASFKKRLQALGIKQFKDTRAFYSAYHQWEFSHRRELTSITLDRYLTSIMGQSPMSTDFQSYQQFEAYSTADFPPA
jgi:hypothetical protein